MMDVVEQCGLSRSAGGLFYAISSLCRAMQDDGVGLKVFGKDDPFVAEDRFVWGGVETTAFNSFGPLQSSLQLRSMLKTASPDLVHQHGIWLDDQWAALQWQKKTGRSVVVSPHGMLDPWALANSAWKKKMIGRLFANESLKRASCIHALCRSEADSIRAYGLKNPLAVIPNGIHLPTLGNPKQAGQKKSLLFLGRIHPKKGLDALLAAWAACPEISKDWNLLIAGWDDGNHEQGLKVLAGESVSFVGSKFGVDKEALFRSVDAFILPSFSEGLPMTVLEAWSYGLPVLMTRFCNLPEGFTAEAALEVEPSNASLETGLAELAAMSAGDLCRMGMNGRQLIEQNFTWPKIAEAMKQVYEWCIGGGDLPACMEL